MLSATPHDGKPESFASLMNMFDLTAIADPSDYASEDFSHKGLVVRRFKHDVREQLKGNFPERRIATLRMPATAPEAHLHEVLAGSRFSTLRGTDGAQLFATNLSKALFSSPAALISMVDNRLRRLQGRRQKEPGNDDLRGDMADADIMGII